MTNAIWRVCLKDNMSKLGSLVRERILILDGAMGTMIQQYNLTEEDFRDERFSQIPGQMKGNNDLLCLTRPDALGLTGRKRLVGSHAARVAGLYGRSGAQGIELALALLAHTDGTGGLLGLHAAGLLQQALGVVDLLVRGLSLIHISTRRPGPDRGDP